VDERTVLLEILFEDNFKIFLVLLK